MIKKYSFKETASLIQDRDSPIKDTVSLIKDVTSFIKDKASLLAIIIKKTPHSLRIKTHLLRTHTHPSLRMHPHTWLRTHPHSTLSQVFNSLAYATPKSLL